MDRYYRPGTHIKQFTIIKMLGQGRYGIAYLAEDSIGKKYVIKQLKQEMLPTTRSKLFYEQEILSSLHSPSFPKFMGTFKNRDAEGYILEYMSGKTFDTIVKRDRYEFSKTEIYRIASQLLQIIEYLQASHIVHRDIRLPNVILRKTKDLALIDFGLARYIDNNKYTCEEDYWFLGDFLIRLYYTAYYTGDNRVPLPWYRELSLTRNEEHFLKNLLGIGRSFRTIEEIKYELNELKFSTYSPTSYMTFL